MGGSKQQSGPIRLSQHLILVDASGIAFRAFATSSPVHRESDGEPIGAVLRFTEIVWRMLGAAQHDPATHGAAVFDIPGKATFRHKLYPAYKSNRDPARRLILDGQLPWMKHAAEAVGLYPIEAEGFEADDVIATLAHMAADAGIRTTIVSSDKDFGQLVQDDVIEIVDPMAHLWNKKPRILEADVLERWGVPPAQVPRLQAIAGDHVDCYPGIRGVGPKTAAGILKAYGPTLTAVIRNRNELGSAHLRRWLAKPANRELLVKVYLRLAKLRTDVPMADDVFELMKLKPVEKDHLQAMLAKLQAPKWAMQAIFGLDRTTVRLVPQTAKPLEWWKDELAFPGQKLPEEPQSGCYQRRLVRGGPFVPARIWREPSPTPGFDYLFCVVNGKPADPYSEWARLAQHPITAKQAAFEEADADHARKWRRGDPKANPYKPIDRSKLPLSTNPRRRPK